MFPSALQTLLQYFGPAGARWHCRCRRYTLFRSPRLSEIGRKTDVSLLCYFCCQLWRNDVLQLHSVEKKTHTQSLSSIFVNHVNASLYPDWKIRRKKELCVSSVKQTGGLNNFLAFFVCQCVSVCVSTTIFRSFMSFFLSHLLLMCSICVCVCFCMKPYCVSDGSSAES